MYNDSLEKYYKEIEKIFNDNGLMPPKLHVDYSSRYSEPELHDDRTADFDPTQQTESKITPNQQQGTAELPFSHMADVYTLMIQKAEDYKLPYTVSVDLFFNLLSKTDISQDRYVEIFNKLIEERKSRPDYDYAMGVMYFDIAERMTTVEFCSDLDDISLNVFAPEEEYTLALKHFTNAAYKDPDNSELFYLMAACFAVKGNITSGFSMIEEADTLNSIRTKVTSGNLIKGLRTALRYLITWLVSERKYNDALYFTERLCNLLPLDLHSCIVLNMVFKNFKQYREAIKIWSYHRKLLSTNIIPIHFIGINLMQLNKKYYSASHYFARELKLFNEYVQQHEVGVHNRQVSLLLYELSLGLWNLESGLLDDARKHLIQTSEIIKEINSIKYMPLVVLPQLLDLDREIEIISKSNDCEEFIDKLGNTFEIMTNLMRQSGYFPEDLLQKDSEVKADSLKNIINYFSTNPTFLEWLIRSKCYFIFCLYIVSVKNEAITEMQVLINKLGQNKEDIQTTAISNELNLLKALETQVDNIIGTFQGIGFKREVYAFENLKSFMKRLGYKSLLDIRQDEWHDMMVTLNPSLKSIGESSTIERISEIINIFIGNININCVIQLQPYPKEGEQSINLSDSPDIDLAVYIEFNNGRISISRGSDANRKEVFNDENTQQPYKLLEYLIAKDDHRIYWIEGIKIFKEWQIVHDDICRLEGRFAAIVSKLSGEGKKRISIFQRYGIDLQIVNIGEGTWELQGEYTSNIETAKQLYKEAYESFMTEDFQKAKNLLLEAFNDYSEYAPSWELLSYLISKEYIDDDLLRDALSYYEKKIVTLEGLIYVIRDNIRKHAKVKLKNKSYDELRTLQDLNDLLISFYAETEDLNRSYIRFLSWKDNHSPFLPTSQTLNEYKELRQIVQDQVDIDILLQNKVMRRVISKLQEIYNIPEREAAEILEFVLDRYKDELLYKYVESEDLEKVLMRMARKRPTEIKNIRLSSLTSKDRRDLGLYFKVEKRLSQQLGRQPSQEECLQELCKEKKGSGEYAEYIKTLLLKKLPKVSMDRVVEAREDELVRLEREHLEYLRLIDQLTHRSEKAG